MTQVIGVKQDTFTVLSSKFETVYTASQITQSTSFLNTGTIMFDLLHVILFNCFTLNVSIKNCAELSVLFFSLNPNHITLLCSNMVHKTNRSAMSHSFHQ